MGHLKEMRTEKFHITLAIYTDSKYIHAKFMQFSNMVQSFLKNFAREKNPSSRLHFGLGLYNLRQQCYSTITNSAIICSRHKIHQIVPLTPQYVSHSLRSTVAILWRIYGVKQILKWETSEYRQIVPVNRMGRPIPASNET